MRGRVFACRWGVVWVTHAPLVLVANLIDTTWSRVVTRSTTTFMAWRERGAEARIDAVPNRVEYLTSDSSWIRSYRFHRGMMLLFSIVVCPKTDIDGANPTGRRTPF